MKQLLLLIYIVPGICMSQPAKFRQYKKNKQFRYQLTTESFRNNQFDSKSISVSQHTIVEDSNTLAEEIKWLSKTVYSTKDTLQLDSTAQKVPSYKVSLLPNGQVKIPSLTIPEMTGEITDLNTFYIAVSPSLHCQNLSTTRLTLKDSVLKGHFANGKQIIAGEDCIQVTQKLIIRDDKITVIETSFLPPYYTGIDPLIDTIGKQTFSVPNNFQMIRKAAGDKVNLLWGVEEFIITSTLDSRTGQILQADMLNLLNLRMRYNSSPDLKTYDAEIPLTIKRVLHLVLLK